MADKKEKSKDVLVRDIPEETYGFIIDVQVTLLKQGQRKSLSNIILEYLTKGIEASKAGQ
jgi:hypothetical protein